MVMTTLDYDEKTIKLINSFIVEKFRTFGFNNLTEFQKKASPKILQKYSSLVIAPTGSGKTECATIPIFEHIKKTKLPNKIKALYVTPLRALNRDVSRRIEKYAKNNELKIKIRHGDTSQSERKKIRDFPPDILITTPETLVVLLSQKKDLDALSDLEWIIIDELHELLASERGSQLSISLERLQLNSKKEIHRIGLSATIGNITDASKFLVGNNRKCEILIDKSVRKYEVDVKFVDGGIHEVADKIIGHIKEMQIHSPVLLFTNSRGESETLASVLKERTKMKIDLHHGSLSRQVREETETILRDGVPGIVVCTSSLELGLDIGSVELVIHYGSPRQVSKFMQRIGRSKHNRDSSAKGLIITNHADDEFETNAIIQRIDELSIEEQKIHNLSLDVLAHHLVGMTKQLGNVSVETAFRTVKHAYPFRDLTIEEFSNVLKILDSQSLISFDIEQMSFRIKGRSFRYYFQNISTIPDILKYKVIDITTKKFLGTLDQRFVGSYGESGNIFVLRGSQWSILNVDKKSLKVNVEPFLGKSRVPYWEGENIPVDYATAHKVGQLRTKVKNGSVKLSNKIISELNFDTIPDEKTIVIESVRTEEEIVLHTCLGTKINSTLGMILASLLESTLASPVTTKSDAYRICLSSKKRISEKDLINELTSKFEVRDIMSTALKDTNDMIWRTWCVAKQFGIVERGAVYDFKQARYISERFTHTPVVKEAIRELFHDRFDLLNTESILQKIKDKQIVIQWVDAKNFSSLAEPILDSTTKNYPSPVNIDKSILDLVKKRLAKTQHRLVCARCGIWQMLVTPDTIPSPLKCKYCNGEQITATYFSDFDLQKIIQKNHSGKRLSQEEKHKYDKAWKKASLLQEYGKIALTVLSGYGIGPDAQGRILRDMIDEEDYLYKQIIAEERKYALNRGFWDS